VYDEDKTSEDFGYLIFYSETECRFGIGTKTTFGHLHYDTAGFVGIYGSLKDAIDNL
jgi:hypothetical protein